LDSPLHTRIHTAVKTVDRSRLFKMFNMYTQFNHTRRIISNSVIICFALINNTASLLYSKFNIYGSVHRNNILLYKSQQDGHFTEFILSDNCSTCFGRYYHPFSGAQTTVTTASGNRYTVLLFAVIVEVLELFHDGCRQQYSVTVTRSCCYSCLCS